ncbi:MAG: hypothetical protein AAFP20_16220 [Cyanobacteria bacterium J06614_10]
MNTEAYASTASYGLPQVVAPVSGHTNLPAVSTTNNPILFVLALMAFLSFLRSYQKG